VQFKFITQILQKYMQDVLTIKVIGKNAVSRNTFCIGICFFKFKTQTVFIGFGYKVYKIFSNAQNHVLIYPYEEGRHLAALSQIVPEECQR